MRKLLLFLFVLLVLVVGLDIGGRALAESKAGESIGSNLGTTAPSVAIHGFSFLVQAIPGNYLHVTLTSSDIKAGPISGIAATMELYDIHFPISDAISGATGQLTAGQATLTGVISDAAVAAAMGQTGVQISAGTNGAIMASSSVSIAGRQVPVSAELVTSYVDGVLHLDATSVSAAGITLPNVPALSSKLSLSLPLTELPFTLDAATLSAAGQNLILTATASDVRIVGGS